MEKVQSLLNINDVVKTYQMVAHEKQTEIRLVDPHKINPPKSIFVSTQEDFVKACEEHNGKYNVYVGINERKEKGTFKKDVLSVKTIVIDIDPERTKDTCSNETELQ